MHTIMFKLVCIHNHLLRIVAKHVAIYREMKYEGWVN